MPNAKLLTRLERLEKLQKQREQEAADQRLTSTGVGFKPKSIILQPDFLKPDIVCSFKSGLDNLPSILITIFVSLLRFFSLQINPKK